MSDQAQGLRALADQARRDHNGHPLYPASVPGNGTPGANAFASGVAVADARLHPGAETGTGKGRCARVIAVTSGKGGVGKTNFSSNLSLLLAQTGQRVIVMDADLGLANLHVVLGVSPPYHLEHVMRGEKSLREILHPGPGGIQIVGGASGITELANLENRQRDVFLNGLQELDSLADIILIDTGAGLSHNVLAFLNAVDEIIVVTTPEPTAITDAYATIKVMSKENPQARLMLVVNMAQSEAEAEAVAVRVNSIVRRFLNIEIEMLGSIPFDTAVGRAVRSQQPFTLSAPGSPAAQSIALIANRLGYRKPGAGMNGFLDKMQRFFGFSRTGPTSGVR